jgi:protein involved in sex pheromone biosynthesis
MATKRLLGVEFLREGLKAQEQSVMPEQTRSFLGGREIARRRAVLTYSPDILRTLRDMKEANGLSSRALFAAVKDRVQDANFGEFQVALDDAYENRYVEIVGKDEFGDPKYRPTQLAQSITPA